MQRLVIAEDQAIAREALRLVLEREGYDVVGDAADGLETLRLLRAQRPDVLVLGLRLRRLNGIEVTRRALRAFPSLKVLVLSEIDNATTIAQCARAGASGFVSKTGDFAEFFLALQAILHARQWFPAAALAGGAGTAPDTGDTRPLEALTQRELSVLRYLAQGVRIRDIALEMALNQRTVNTYKARLFRKLDVHSVVELADFARRHRLTPPGEVPGDAKVFTRMNETQPASPYPETHALFDLLPFSVSVRSLDGHVVFANRYLRTWLGHERLQTFRSASVREQARIFGVDEKTSEQVEAVFADAVSRGVAYRLDAVGVSGGEPVIAVHWGAPVTDQQGAATLMLCGSLNVNGAEHIAVGLHEELEARRTASEARATLLMEHGEGLAIPLSAAIALLNGASGAEPGSTATPGALAQALAQLQDATTQLERMRFFAATSDPSSESSTERCDFREVTRGVVLAMAHASPMQFPMRFSGRGSGAVWLDHKRYVQLLTALLHHAATSGDIRECPVAVHATLRAGGMVDIEIRIGPDGAHAKRQAKRTADARARAAQLEFSLCEKMTHALHGTLRKTTTSGASAIVLTLSLPRASKAM